MDTGGSDARFQLAQWQWFVFRFFVYCLPVFFFGVAIYCFIKHVPNSHSIVPKSVIALINALGFFLWCSRLDLAVSSPKTNVKEKRLVVIGLPIIVVLIALLMILLSSSRELSMTGDGQPLLPMFWLLMGIFAWVFARERSNSKVTTP